ncbi:MAG: peptidoglycan-binding protein [Candidatus Aenigmarchaeota archaeon]|nr:peptidoglycan-binding protein [Candidatus Aenigmarchaeota archaeon]
MKKGMAPQIYLAMTLIIMFIILATLLFDLFGAGKKVEMEETKNTYVLLNALKTAKLYVESSLDFSVYQSVYNNSKYGGYYDISPPVQTMTNELLPLCLEHMKKYEGCLEGATDRWNETLYADLKYEGEEYFDIYPVGLLQCILSRLRSQDTGEIYYYLKDVDRGNIKQIDCDFGEVTDKGLRGFQKDYGLEETGVLNSETLEKLEGVFVSKWGDCSKFFFVCEDRIKDMVFWQTIPSEQKVLEELKKAIKNKMVEYTSQDYNFMEEYVKLPVYEESDITFERKDYGFLNIILKSSDYISVTEEDKKIMERINMRISPDMSKEYPIRYLDLYEIAKQTFNEVENLKYADYIPGDKIKHKEKLSGFVIDVEVFDEFILKISIKDITRTFPVFNGTGVSFEPITFEYLVQIT